MKNQTIKQFSVRSIFLSGLLTLAFFATGFGQLQTTSVFVAGLSQPTKIIQTPLDNLIVTETGGAPNSGQISIIDEFGNRRVLVSGLPSGIGTEGPSGPTGLDMRGRTLFVAIGQGDGVLPGPIPGTMIPNPNPSSPLLSSVLRIEFSPNVERYGQGFSLSLADQAVIANGGVVTLRNGNLNSISISKAADFPNSVPNPIPPFPGNVRQSNPFALAIHGDNLYVVDGGMNAVFKVDILSGTWRPLAVFPPRPNPLPFGPPVIEAVPTGIRVEGNDLLVTLFTGFPFVPGLSEVRQVDTRTGAHRTLIGGRSSAIDVLEGNFEQNGMFSALDSGGRGDRGNRIQQNGRTQRGERMGQDQTLSQGHTQYFVLEFSTNMLQNQPGQLLAFESTFYAPQVVAGGLISPSGMVRDKKSGDIFITEIFTGRIIRVHLPPWLF